MCAQINFTKVGESYVGLFMIASGVSDVFTFTAWSMVKSGNSCSIRFSLLPIAESPDSALMASCFNPAGWMTSKSNSHKRRYQRASCPAKSK